MSLKPPWRQKNPVMEKACQVYHRNTAPEEIVNLVEKIKFTSGGGKTKTEFVHNGTRKSPAGEVPMSVVHIYNSGRKHEETLLGFMFIAMEPERFDIRIGKTESYPLKVVLKKDGEKTLFESGRGWDRKWRGVKIERT